jgi:hypothetical protein
MISQEKKFRTCFFSLAGKEETCIDCNSSWDSGLLQSDEYTMNLLRDVANCLETADVAFIQNTKQKWKNLSAPK